MSVIVLVNLTIKEGFLIEFKNFIKGILPDTRSFEGCQGIQLYQNKEFPTKFTIHAKWDSVDSQKKYMAWRMEIGSFDKLQPMLSGDFDMQFYEIFDA